MGLDSKDTRVATRRRAGVVVLLAAVASTAMAPSGAARERTPVEVPAAGAYQQVTLQFSDTDARRGGAALLQVVERVQGTGALPQRRTQEVTPFEVLAVGVDADGREVWQDALADPRQVRSEAVDADGHVVPADVTRGSSQLTLDVPDGLGVVRVQLFEPDPADRFGRGASIASVAVGSFGSAESAPDRPLANAARAAAGANRVDIAVVGDGYTSGQMAKYAGDVTTVVNGLLGVAPLSEYASYFSVHRVDVTSAQSGADHPEAIPPTYRNTALDATYDCSGIDRLICVDETAVFDAVDAVLTPAERDIVIVLVNDTVYGGSGGSVAVTSLDPSAIDLVAHELGHSFGGLADEYFSGSDDPSCYVGVEGINVTSKATRSAIPWKHWVAAATPVPTLSSANGVPGLYEGAAYCQDDVYRPTYDSKMRSLDRPFEQINTEQLVKRIYGVVDPIDASAPSATVLTKTPGGSQVFSVTKLVPATHTLTTAWTLDGVAVGSGNTYTLAFNSLGVGNHTVTAKVTDTTSMVRSDPEALLVGTRVWRFADVPTPFASWTAFVTRQFQDVVGRAPTGSELTLWTTSLANGTKGRGDLDDFLRRSSENTTNVDPTARLYRAFLGRAPDAGGLKYWIGRRRSGSWSLTRMSDAFAGSSEFRTKYGALTNRQFVTRIYTDVLGRTADAAGVDYWTGRLDAGAKTRGGVMIGFSESSEYKRKQAENTDVAVAYILLVGRAPTAGETLDWVTRQQAAVPHPKLLLDLLASPTYADHITG